MGKRVYVITHILSIFFMLLTLAGYMGGLFGEAWWKFKTGSKNNTIVTYQGLLRYCQYFYSNKSRTCSFRADVFDFNQMGGNENGAFIPDILLLLFVVSAGLIIISYHILLTLFCCTRNGTLWKSGIGMAVLFTILAMLVTLAGLTYEEIVGSHTYRTSWSAMLTWLGFATNLVSFVVASILGCLPPPFEESKQIEQEISPGRSAGYSFYIREPNGPTHRFYDDITIENMGGTSSTTSVTDYHMYDDACDLDKFAICENYRARYVRYDGKEDRSNGGATAGGGGTYMNGYTNQGFEDAR